MNTKPKEAEKREMIFIDFSAVGKACTTYLARKSQHFGAEPQVARNCVFT